MLILSDTLRKMVTKGTSANELEEVSMKDGMIALRCDGMRKVADGLTTPIEIMRNVFTIL